MRLDPFRIQVLTLSLDSQFVLILVGLAAAGWMFGKAARRHELDLGAGHWWDLAIYAAVGGRLLWIVGHPDYYLRQPLQAVVILDGGLSTVGLALGAGYWIWRSSRIENAAPWWLLVDLVAIAALTALLFERVGCALTTCGSGPVSQVPWAMLRGDAWQMPMALEQVAVLAVALAVGVEAMHRRRAAFATALVAWVLVETIELWAGRSVIEGVLTLAALLMMYAMPWAYAVASRRAAQRSKKALGRLEQ
jgi:prolipoprotein diacylglyceryltransferase